MPFIVQSNNPTSAGGTSFITGNSTISLQDLVDDASSLGDVAPALATAGFSDTPALSMANDVMSAMITGGPMGQRFNWKWNRFTVTPFATISYQQDYFVPGVINLGWLENTWASNINQVSNPKQKVMLEVRRDLDVTYQQTGYPGKIAWLPNSQLQTGTWGANPLGPTVSTPSGITNSIGPLAGGLQNPGPNVVYTNPVGAIQSPINATTCITDPNGHLWVATTYGTCGSVEPTWPTNPAYPTIAAPSTTATTVADGTVVWSAINPQGQGFRLSPIPPQSGIVWWIEPIAQAKPPRFANLAQLLDPIPDEYSTYFKQGFFAECYRRSADPRVRARYTMERQIWLEALDKSVRQGNTEQDDMGFYPGTGLMDSGYGFAGVRADRPYGPY